MAWIFRTRQAVSNALKSVWEAIVCVLVRYEVGWVILRVVAVCVGFVLLAVVLGVFTAIMARTAGIVFVFLGGG